MATEPCPHAGFTVENAERLMADEIHREQEFLRKSQADADRLLDVLYNDHTLGKYLLKRQKQDDLLYYGAESVQPRNDHNELSCVVNICKNILFAAPPEGADADLTEAELQREEIIRHHRLLYALRKLHPVVFDEQVNPHTRHVLEQFHKDLTDELCRSHNAGISFPDPDLLRRRKRPDMDSDAEELLTEFASMKKKKLAELRSQLTKRIKDEIDLSLQDVPPPTPAKAAAQPAAALATALASATLTPAPSPPPAAPGIALPAPPPAERQTPGELKLNDPAVLAAMMSIDPSLALQMASATEHANKREEKKRKRKKEKKEEEERRLSGSTYLPSDDPGELDPPTINTPVKPALSTSINNTGAPSFKKSLRDKQVPGKAAVPAQAAPPTANPTDSPKTVHPPGPVAADVKKPDVGKKTFGKQEPVGRQDPKTGRADAEKGGFPKLKKRGAEEAAAKDVGANKTPAQVKPSNAPAPPEGERKTSGGGGGLARRMAKIAATKKEDEPGKTADKKDVKKTKEKGEKTVGFDVQKNKGAKDQHQSGHKKDVNKPSAGRAEPTSGAKKVEGADKPKLDRKDAGPQQKDASPGRKTIEPGDPRPVVYTGKEVGDVAEESKKAVKVAALKTSLKLLTVKAKDTIKSGQVTGSKPPSTFAAPPKK